MAPSVEDFEREDLNRQEINPLEIKRFLENFPINILENLRLSLGQSEVKHLFDYRCLHNYITDVRRVSDLIGKLVAYNINSKNMDLMCLVIVDKVKSVEDILPGKVFYPKSDNLCGYENDDVPWWNYDEENKRTEIPLLEQLNGESLSEFCDALFERNNPDYNLGVTSDKQILFPVKFNDSKGEYKEELQILLDEQERINSL